jgi:hypothetical protein
LDTDLEEQRRKGHATYMRFYRSLRHPSCPKTVSDKYRECKGRARPGWCWNPWPHLAHVERSLPCGRTPRKDTFLLSPINIAHARPALGVRPLRRISSIWGGLAPQHAPPEAWSVAPKTVARVV